MDDTTSLRLVLSSTRYNSPRSEYGVSFPDYAGVDNEAMVRQQRGDAAI